MADINVFVCSGRLTKPVHFSQTKNGKDCARFTLAINTGWGDYERTDFLGFVAYGGHAKFMKEQPVGTRVELRGEVRRDYDSENQKEYNYVLVSDVINAVRPSGDKAAAKEEKEEPVEFNYSLDSDDLPF
jgi:single-stranded DNA-binding protein